MKQTKTKNWLKMKMETVQHYNILGMVKIKVVCCFYGWVEGTGNDQGVGGGGG